MTYEQFLWDPMTQDAVVRNFEIIGEATKNLPEISKPVILCRVETGSRGSGHYGARVLSY